MAREWVEPEIAFRRGDSSTMVIASWFATMHWEHEHGVTALAHRLLTKPWQASWALV